MSLKTFFESFSSRFQVRKKCSELKIQVKESCRALFLFLFRKHKYIQKKKEQMTNFNLEICLQVACKKLKNVLSSGIIKHKHKC